MKMIIYVYLALLMIGCARNEDPFKNLDLGKVKYKDFKMQMVKKSMFFQPDRDSTSFKYFLEDGESKYLVEATLNSDGYYFGNLRNIYIDLASDSISLDNKYFFMRSAGPRSKDEVDDIFKLYCKWYGKPDSIYVNKKSNNNMNLIESMFYYNSIKGKDTTCPPQTYYWYRKNLEIKFFRPYPEKVKKLDSTYYVYKGAKIIYSMKEYSYELAKIKDSIRKSFTPNDLVSIHVFNPKWIKLNPKINMGCNTEFEIEFGEFERKDEEEPRSLKAIRFDIVISDSFNKEMFRTQDITQELKEPIRREANGIYYNVLNSNSTIYHMKYNSYWKNYSEIEKVRLYHKNNRVKVYADIKAVVFDDGDVLN